MGWQLLICRPSDWAGRDRVAVWRQLRRSGALSLGQGTWALPDDDEGQRRADLLEESIHGRHGHVLRLEVPDADPRTGEVEALVDGALDREWDRLARALDQAAPTVMADGDDPRAVGAIESLRRSYVEMLDRDRRDGPATEDAAQRLSLLVDALGAHGWAAARGPDVGSPQVRRRTPVLAQPGGPHRLELDPFPGYAWEQDFREFECRTYMPATDRPALRHGVFTIEGDADALDVAMRAVEQRIAVFALSAAPQPALRVVAQLRPAAS